MFSISGHSVRVEHDLVLLRSTSCCHGGRVPVTSRRVTSVLTGEQAHSSHSDHRVHLENQSPELRAVRPFVRVSVCVGTLKWGTRAGLRRASLDSDCLHNSGSHHPPTRPPDAHTVGLEQCFVPCAVRLALSTCSVLGRTSCSSFELRMTALTRALSVE